MSTMNTNRITDDLSCNVDQPEWQRQLNKCQQATSNVIQDNPLAATIVVFGVGFCVGTAIGAALGEADSRHRDHLATSLGRRLVHSMNDLVPDNLQQHLRS
ncbi:MAG: hypothetical protein KDA93_22870 [Planctomycetaceae bacterium]|nr:hypothetical protein [Planctomycetaceae bacterium]